jgi:hypothetical protein
MILDRPRSFSETDLNFGAAVMFFEAPGMATPAQTPEQAKIATAVGEVGGLAAGNPVKTSSWDRRVLPSKNPSWQPYRE